MLYDLLIESVEKYPERVAVCDEKREITYTNLLLESQCIALELYKKRYIVQSNVGIILEKSIWYIEAIFGTLACNMSYVPLNTNLPEAKLDYIIKRANIQTVITDRKHLSIVKNKVDVIILDDIFNEKPDGDGIELPSILRYKENIAYILFTSGSTGQPKGIEISHRASLAFINWAKTIIKAGSDDVFASHAPFYFDLSIFDIFVSISVGAKLVICPRSISAFPRSLINFIIENKVSIWYSVPSIIIQMSKVPGFENVKLKTLIYAGESMPVKFVEKIYKLTNNRVAIYNFYGPTETNVISFHKIEEEDFALLEIPIGISCPYANIEIRKEECVCAQVGEVGELVVKTESLMTGYCGDQRLLQETYYHTGDIVKLLEGDVYEFVGRIDNMVKLNGYRIELEEIENTIRRFPNINNCIVHVQHEKDMDVLCCTYDSDIELDEKELHRFLLDRLEEYKIPTRFLHSTQLKINENGKIDRNRVR